MGKSGESDLCPCGRGARYAACCGAYISGERSPPTAEALMRSRYSAYVHGERGYLLQTWHGSTRPAESAFVVDDHAKWLGLKVVACTAGQLDDDAGEVEFVARYKVGGKAVRLHERSRFVKEAGRWFYVDGERGNSDGG